MNRIDGKIAVVTGGMQGLGAAIAKLFAKASAAGIAIVGRDVEKGQKVADSITDETGTLVQMIAANLEHIEDVRSIIPEADGRFGRVDILINAAGLTERGNMLNTTPELFDRMFAVNVRAPFFLMQDAIKVMQREGSEGRIVNIGSTSERAGQPFWAPYSASKGALATLALTPIQSTEAAKGKQAAKSKPLRVTVYRTKRRGRYSYKKSDTIGTRNIYRFVHPPRQSSGGPFDTGFFFETPRGPYGGYTPYMQRIGRLPGGDLRRMLASITCRSRNRLPGHAVNAAIFIPSLQFAILGEHQKVTCPR